MANENGAWARQGEAFWRAHHEAWKRSDLNQRQYCEFHNPAESIRELASEVQTRTGCSATQAALPAWPAKSPPKSSVKSSLKSPLKSGDLSYFGHGRSHSSAAARGASTPVQRSR